MKLPQWYAQWLEPALAVSDFDLFFVMGCQKSGTTWVQHLLNAHPAACCGGEGHLADHLMPMLGQIFDTYNKRQHKRPAVLRPLLTQTDLAATARMLNDRILLGHLQKKNGGDAKITALGDKTPENALSVRLLADLYPGAKFIHIIRDGRDACVSGWLHLQRLGKAERFSTLAQYAAFFAEHHWRHYINRARTDATTLPGRYLELSYESLHADPESQIRRMLRFLHLDAASEAVSTCLAAGSFENLTQGRVRGQEDANSFYRKGAVGDWQEHFDEATERAFAQHAGGLLEELGYARSQANVG